MNRKLGFDVVQVLVGAESVEELDEAMRIVNNTYPILHDHLEIIEELNGQHKVVEDNDP